MKKGFKISLAILIVVMCAGYFGLKAYAPHVE